MLEARTEGWIAGLQLAGLVMLGRQDIPVFVEALRYRLQRSQSELVPELHQRASRWYEQQDVTRDAVHHALAGADFEQAARLTEQNAERLVKHGGLATLRAVLEALPAELVQSRVELGLWHGWLLAQNGQFDAAERLLQALEQRLRTSPIKPPLTELIRAV